MAILIDMDMPENCGECEFCHTENFETWCCPTGREDILHDARPDWCPLREVVMCRECESYIKSENESEVWELCNHGMVSIHSVDGEGFCSRGKRREE